MRHTHDRGSNVSVSGKGPEKRFDPSARELPVTSHRLTVGALDDTSDPTT